MSVSIFTFLSDQYQHELKEKAIGKNKRFEGIMRSYIELFISELKKLESLKNCPELNELVKDMKDSDRDNLFTWLSSLESKIVSNIDDFEGLMNQLVNIYLIYIKGNTNKAYIELGNILDKNNLLNVVSNDYMDRNYKLTFRGRPDDLKGQPSTAQNMKKKDGFYHVPFDLLKKAGNYRFSIIGQPFIYLGASLPTVILELRKDIESIVDVHLSSWYLKEKGSIKLYDISNFLYDLINLQIIPMFKDSSPVPLEGQIYPREETFYTDFMKFILSQFCTFKKLNEGDVFIEQYVIPQLLTNQIKNNPKLDYEGFIFPSTQYQSKITTSNNRPYFGMFKNNVALFTSYSENEKYDNYIIEKFEVTPFDTSQRKDFVDFKTYCESVSYNKTKKNNEQVMLKAQLDVYHDYMGDMFLDSHPLNDCEAMQLQFAHMINTIKSL